MKIIWIENNKSKDLKELKKLDTEISESVQKDTYQTDVVGGVNDSDVVSKSSRSKPILESYEPEEPFEKYRSESMYTKEMLDDELTSSNNSKRKSRKNKKRKRKGIEHSRDNTECTNCNVSKCSIF